MAEDDSQELRFIRQNFDWDKPEAANVIANLSVSKISLTDLADILGCTLEDVKDNIEKRPMLKAALLAGPKFADSQVVNKVYQQAVSGDRVSQQLWVNKRLSNKSSKPDVTIDDDPIKMLQANVPNLIQRGLELAYETDDLTKFNSYLGFVMDRVYGKVIDKVQHSGNLTLDSIFASLPNTTGLPKKEYIDAVLEQDYNNITPVTVMSMNKDN